MAKKQTNIPGTERKILPELIDKAENYKAKVAERLEVQDEEAELKQILKAEIRARVEDGSLTIDTDADGVSEVYRYKDEEGQAKVIKFGNEEKVSVINDRSKDAAA